MGARRFFSPGRNDNRSRRGAADACGRLAARIGPAGPRRKTAAARRSGCRGADRDRHQPLAAAAALHVASRGGSLRSWTAASALAEGARVPGPCWPPDEEDEIAAAERLSAHRLGKAWVSRAREIKIGSRQAGSGGKRSGLAGLEL